MYCVEQGRMHPCSTPLVEEAPSRVLVVEYVGNNGFFSQITSDGRYGDEYRRWFLFEKLSTPVMLASLLDDVPKDEAKAVARYLRRCRCAASGCG